MPSLSHLSEKILKKYSAGEWKVGGYYNYCAASAGSYCYGNGTSAGTSSGNATSSICPKGWRMPTGNTGETTALYNAYSSGNPNQYTAFRTASPPTPHHHLAPPATPTPSEISKPSSYSKLLMLQ